MKVPRFCGAVKVVEPLPSVVVRKTAKSGVLAKAVVRRGVAADLLLDCCLLTVPPPLLSPLLETPDGGDDTAADNTARRSAA